MRLECAWCGAGFYSVDAREMVARGERCDCGGPLLLPPPRPEGIPGPERREADH